MDKGRKYSDRRGFTLLEVLVVFFLTATLIGITALSLRRTTDQEGSRGLAFAVASDLRAARAEAQRSGALVAYCLPRSDTPFARSAVTRKGEQRGDIYRTHGYSGDFDASIFVGGWPGAALAPGEDLPDDWQTAVTSQHAIFFRPDGTAFSSTVPRLNGHFHLLVGRGFTLAGEVAGLPSLSAVTDPNLITVSESGSVSVVERQTPAGSVPAGGEPPADVAEIAETAPPSEAGPTITDIRFLPSRVPGLEPGIGQTYTQIHPEQREGDDLEYGLATLEVRASDPSGGPLYYELTSTPTAGLPGNFSAQGQGGRMTYTPRADGGWDWTSVVAWRPPPGASPDTEYEFQVRVYNDRGLEHVVASGAGLLPVFRTLDSPRLAIAANDGQVYLANIDGASLLRATRDLEIESRPFFSPDGTRLFTFNDSDPDSSQLIVRNADGTGRRILSDIPISSDEIEVKFDPLYAFAAYSFESTPPVFDYYVPVEVPNYGGGGDDGWTPPEYEITGPFPGSPSQSRTLKILHLNSQDELTLTVALSTEGGALWGWDGTRPFHINFQEYIAKDTVSAPGIVVSGPNPYIPAPGYQNSDYQTKQLLGYPPTVVDAGLAPPQPNYTAYRNLVSPQWTLAKYDSLEAGEGTYLRLRNTATSANEDLGAVDEVMGEPNWSSDGTSVIYIQRDGAGNFRLQSRKLLTETGGLDVEAPVTVLTRNGVSDPKLSPDGQFVYYRQSGHLWRCRVQADSESTVVRLSGAVPSGVRSYAITR
jgi:type II secretory pathway pseudopilin PulG